MSASGKSAWSQFIKGTREECGARTAVPLVWQMNFKSSTGHGIWTWRKMPQRNGPGATELPTPAPGRDLRAAHHRILFWVMLIALILRIAGLIAEPKVIENEGAEYARIAYNIRNGHGYIGTMSGSELL